MGRARIRSQSSLIAIDPGDKAGIAVFYDQLLVRAELVVGASERGWVWQGPYQMHVVCEMPQKYRGSIADMQSLLKLAFTAGYLVSSTQPSSLRLVLPREWKGQRPKTADNHYSQRLLGEHERALLDGADHNVLDAVGLGLWALGRR